MAQRETFSTRIDPDLIKELKYLSADEKRPLNDLLEESIRDLLIKRGKGSRKE